MAEYITQAKKSTNISFATPSTMVMNTESSFPRTTKLECEADQLLPSTAEVKNAQSSTKKTTSLIQTTIRIKYFLPAVFLGGGGGRERKKMHHPISSTLYFENNGR